MIKTLKPPARSDQSGSILVGLLAASVAFIIIGFSLMSASVSQYSNSGRTNYAANALLTAEAGVEQSLYSLNQDVNFTGYGTEQQFFNDAQQGKGTYSTAVAPGAGNAKTITSTARVYKFNKPSEVISTRIVKVTVVGTTSPGYSVHTGPGGLILSGSANITNSNVYVNGFITLSGAAKIGTAAQPLDVKVANQRCPTSTPPGPTYPQVCTSGEPISMAHSTAIYGTVCATGQVSTGPNNNIKTGTGGQGLVPGCVAPPTATPAYTRPPAASWTTTGAGNSNTYVCNSWPFDRTWPAHLKLTGHVNVGGSCNVKIKGDTYITGDLTLGGAAIITVDESVGTTRPVVIVDGKITTGGSARIIANSQGTGIHFISFKSSAGCNPNCTSLSGNDLKTSQNLETVNIGGAVNLPGMIFQAYWGKLVLGGSGNVGSVIGQTIDMSGAGTVTFGTSLSSGDRTWTVTSYQQKYQ